MTCSGSLFQTEEIEGIRYLTIDALTFINCHLIALQTPEEPVGVLKPGELSSSQLRPAQHRYWTQEQDMFVLAAVLMESLIRNHPFQNANKRTAAMAGALFLLINGYELTGPGHELVDLMVGIARRDYSVDDLESWLCYWSRPFNASELNDPDSWINLFCASLEFPEAASES
jgi:death-on-curing protein